MLKKYFGFYGRLFKLNISLKLVYNVNFWVGFFSDLAGFLILLATFSVIYSNVDTINGWNKYQMIFFLGSFIIVDSLIMSLVFIGVASLPGRIRSGDLDYILLKPINTRFYASVIKLNPGFLLNSFYGIILLIYSSFKLNIQISSIKILGYIFLLFLSFIIYYATIFSLRCLAFWFVRIDGIAKLEEELIYFAYRTPGVSYKGVIRILLFTILPFGVIATIPTQFFTEIMSFQHVLFSVSLCMAYMLFSSILWKKGLKKYSSASS